LVRLQVLLGKENVEVAQLKVGDYVDATKVTVGIEGKSPKDFCGSICDGRLWQQAEELNQTFEHSYIFIEGSIEDVMLHRGGMTWQSVIGVIGSLFAHYNIPVVFSDIFYEELLVKVMEKHLTVSEKTYSPLRKIKRTPATHHDWQIYILESFPRVGKDRAILLLEYFGTLERIFRASKEELMNIEGIGTVIAEGILEALK
jgi:ERCC4-type nuclease